MKMMLVMWVFLSTSFIYSFERSDLVGLWEMPKNEQGKITVAEIFEYDDEFFALGFVYTDLVPSDEKDVKNPDKFLQNRMLSDTIIVSHVRVVDDKLVGGEIYNPSVGKYYYLRGAMNPDLKTIEWKATIDKSGVFGKSIQWKKIEDPSTYASYRKSQKFLQSKILSTRSKK